MRRDALQAKRAKTPMSAPELPGFIYDPVRKRYFKDQPASRTQKREPKSLPDRLNPIKSRERYLTCVDSVIAKQPLSKEDLEWFKYQNLQFQLATTYELPEFISVQGQSEIQLGISEHSIILNDANFRLYELGIDISDDLFKITFDRDSMAHQAITYFRTCREFSVSINRFNDFNLSTAHSDLIAGKLKQPHVADVSTYRNIQERTTALLFLSSKSFQWCFYEGSILRNDIEFKMSKKYGDALSCLSLSDKTGLIGFRNGHVYRFQTSEASSHMKLQPWFKTDGPIISITKVTQHSLRLPDVLLSVGKHPYQKILRINGNAKLVSEFHSRYSNLSRNKEILKIIQNKQLHCIAYGKTSETGFDIFPLDIPGMEYPVNLNWTWPVSSPVMDILPFCRDDDSVLFDLKDKKIRKRSVPNVIFHDYNDYLIDYTRFMILTKDSNNRLVLQEYTL